MKAGYIKTKIRNLISISRIVTIHYYEFDETFAFEGEKHDFWEMVYIDKGKAEITADDRTLVLEQGEIIFHKPNEFHSIRSYRSSPNYCVISFVCDSPAMSYFEKYKTVLARPLCPLLTGVLEEAELTYVIPKNDTRMKKLVLRDNPPIGGEQLIKTYLEQLLILLVRQMCKEKRQDVFPSRESLESHLRSRVEEYIAAHIREKITIADLCRESGYSKSYLCKLFRSQSGKTITHYVIEEKIKVAKQLIREHNMNFSEISDYLSFDNPQYFSRVFHRVTGLSPSEFKLTLKR